MISQQKRETLRQQNKEMYEKLIQEQGGTQEEGGKENVQLHLEKLFHTKAENHEEEPKEENLNTTDHRDYPQKELLHIAQEVESKTVNDIHDETHERINELKRYQADFLADSDNRQMQDPKELERLQAFIGHIRAKTTPPPVTEEIHHSTTKKPVHIRQEIQQVLKNIQKDHHVPDNLNDTTPAVPSPSPPSPPSSNIVENPAKEGSFSNNIILQFGHPEIFLQSVVLAKEQTVQFYHCLAALIDDQNAISPYENWYKKVKDANMLGVLDMMLLNNLQLAMEKKHDRKVFLTPYFFLNLSKHALSEPGYSEDMEQFLNDFKQDKPDHPLLRRLIFMMSEDSPHQAKSKIESLRKIGVKFCLDGARLTNLDIAPYKEKGYIFIRIKEESLQKEVNEEGIGDLIRAKNKIEQAGIDIIVTGINNATKAQNISKLDISYASGNFYNKPFQLSSIR